VDGDQILDDRRLNGVDFVAEMAIDRALDGCTFSSPCRSRGRVREDRRCATALLRDPAELTLRHERLAIVLDGESVRCAIVGHDAVVSAMGVRDTAIGRSSSRLA
jgi:hypothetical protein